jgi:hypothetical protein
MAAALLVGVARSSNRLVHALIAQHRLGALAAGQPGPVAAVRSRTLVAEHCKGSERDGHLNDDRAGREQTEFSLDLRILREQA